MYRSLRFRTQAQEGQEFATAQLNGQEHVIVPVVALVQGVVWGSNADSPELALASEFAKIPEGWDGRPIVLDHPRNDEGKPIHANQPTLWDGSVVGQLFNSQRKDDSLVAEMWLNKERLPESELKRLQTGVVEVSTGLFATTEERYGFWDGEEYFSIWRNVVPDHLAILPEGTTGACSVADGCGAPRTQKGRLMANCGKRCECDTCKTTKTQSQVRYQSNLKAFSAMFEEVFQAYGLKIEASDIGDLDKREALYSALQVENTNRYCYILQVFSDSFVYVEYSFDGGGGTFRRNYKIQNDGTVVLSSDKTSVRPETDYVPVVVKIQSKPKGDDPMSGTTKTPEQEAQAKPQAEAEAKAEAEMEAKTQAEAKAKQEAEEKLRAEVEAKVRAEQEEKAKKEAEQKQQTEALAYYNARREGLVKALSGKADMTEEELKGLSVGILEKMAKSLVPNAAGDVDFTGASPAPVKTESSKGAAYTPPTEAFPVKKAEK